MLSADIIQVILSHLENPVDLLKCAEVSKDWYQLSRSNVPWERHRTRILKFAPELMPLFDQFGMTTRTDDGRRQRPKRRKKSELWVCPKGIWHVFARHLLPTKIDKILSKKSANYVLEAICRSIVMPSKFATIITRYCPVQEFVQCRFKCCLLLTNYRMLWVGMYKNSGKVAIHTDREKWKVCTTKEFLHNFQQILRNKPISKYLI